jgi:hypothetical protein
MNSYVINGLLEQAGILKGEIKAIEDNLARKRLDLAHVLATLRMFQPELDDKTIYPRRPASQRSEYFVQGEITDLSGDTTGRQGSDIGG